MQLWKKNYLITMTVFTLLLATGISLLVNILFYGEYQREIQSVHTEKSTLLKLLSMKDLSSLEENLFYLGENLRSDNRYFKIESEGQEILEDTFPFSFGQTDAPAILVRHKEGFYLIFHDTLRQEEQSWEFFYGKDVRARYTSHERRLLISWGIFLLLLFLVGIIQYLAMKRIYLPVSQISHELRNPLTIIQGYAQYLRTGILTEEDRIFAEDQLIQEAASLRKTADKLLIMGNLREGRIRSQNISMDMLLNDLQTQYPSLKIENHIASVQADETLIKSLLGNLLANAFRHSEQVSLRTQGSQIIIWNGGSSIDPRTLNRLNRRKSPAPDTVIGNGIGISICHDILRIYHGRLRYRIPSAGGTEAVITLPPALIREKH